jgi:molybdate transport system substrate-binding protein
MGAHRQDFRRHAGQLMSPPSVPGEGADRSWAQAAAPLNPSGAALHVLCAGAAQGLLTCLEPIFVARTGVQLVSRFSAVGALRDALLAGDACDVMIVTDAMVTDLGALGWVQAEGRALLGRVSTGMAVRDGEPMPDIADGRALALALRAASALHYPDPLRATAGVHFADVLRRLGLLELLAARCRTYPNGATAMRGLAVSHGPGHLGCTQISEIMVTPGVRLIGGLPKGCELVTPYSAAAATNTARPALAQALVSLLGSEEMVSLRAGCGIEPAVDG